LNNLAAEKETEKGGFDGYRPTASSCLILTSKLEVSEIVIMRITVKGQITIPSAMRKKHGLLARAEFELVDRPEGILVVKANKRTGGKRVLSTLLRGGKIKGRTEDWLRLTRGKA
jgi:bifunctional DNA-binding transcriptional regulator/antitoxin component of YhaV-PrlF toxin-antitoxin module